MILFVFLEATPHHVANAAQPLADARGVESIKSSSELKLALNPCIVDGQLPEGCEKYVKNGLVTQPPIKIVLDTSR